MNLKELLGDLLGFNAKIKQVEDNFDLMKENRDYWHNKYDATTKELTISQLNASELQNLVKPIDVPSADISYRRPILIGENKWLQYDIDVRLFVQPDFEIEHSLEKKSLVYDGSQDLDVLIPQIYRFAKIGYKYGSDEQFGFSEYVMFPFEARVAKSKKIGIDCDDHSNCTAAKIPADRWLVSYGLARAGYGHATIYAKDGNGTWRHLNSTKPDYDYKNLNLYPSNKDESDKPGIKSDGFWLSFNSVFSIHAFESKEAEDAYAKAKLNVDISR